MTLVVVLGLLVWAAVRWGPFKDQSAVGRGHAHAPAAPEVPPWLEVRVVDDATGKPAARANVRVIDHGAGRGTPPVQAVTDDEGIARLSGRRPTGTFHVVAVRADFRARIASRKLLGGDGPRVEMELRLQHDSAFDGPAVQLGVRVVDADGYALAGVPVALFDAYASPLETWRRLDTSTAQPTKLLETDVYGVVRFPGPLEGAVTVQARPADRAWATAEVRPQPGPDTTPSVRLVCADEVPVTVHLTHPPGPRTTITAVAPVWFQPLEWSTTHPQAVSERFDAVLEDVATLRLPRHTPSRREDWPDNYARLERAPAGLVLQAGPDLTLFAGWPVDPDATPHVVEVPETCAFRLRVIRAGTGVTVDGARVHVRSEALRAAGDVGAASRGLTDLRGFATVRCVPGRVTDIVVEDPRGFEHRVLIPTGKRPRTGGDGESVRNEPFYVEVPEAAPVVAGRVVMGPFGGSLADVAPILVACLDPLTGAVQRQLAGAEGRYEFNVRSGSYCQLVARAAGWTSQILSARHYDQLELRPVDLVLGRVVDADAIGVAGAVVRREYRATEEFHAALWGARGIGLDRTVSGTDGAFELELENDAQRVSVSAIHPSHRRGKLRIGSRTGVEDLTRPAGWRPAEPIVLGSPAEDDVRLVDTTGAPLPTVLLRIVSGFGREERPHPTSRSDANGRVSIFGALDHARASVVDPDLAWGGCPGSVSLSAPESRTLTLRRIRDVTLLVVDTTGRALPRMVLDVRLADDGGAPDDCWDPRGTLLMTDDEGTITLRSVSAERPMQVRTSDPEAREGQWQFPADARSIRCAVTLLTPAELRRLARIDVELQELAGLDAALHPGRTRRDEMRAELRAEQAQIRRHGLR